MTGDDTGDELVELQRFGDVATAELAAAVVRGSGIHAVVFAADAGGWAPHLGAAGRRRLGYRSYSRPRNLSIGT